MPRIFRSHPGRWYADALIAVALLGLLVAIYRLAGGAPARYATETQISLAPSALPYYAARSLVRMAAAYLLALAFSLAYAYVAARSRRAEQVMLPLLDILQSIPVLSFMPSVVLALVGLFPRGNVGPELASIVLIFTGQAWNITFSLYHSLITVPRELREVAGIYRLSAVQRFRHLELPYAAVGLVWNSMMSWAGGWFFLVASEMFQLGDQSFRLPGLGSYLQAAADAGDMRALLWGLAAMVALIVLLDQLAWRPVLAWADKFKVELVAAGEPPRSAVLTLLRRSALMRWLIARVLGPAGEGFEHLLHRVAALLRRRPLQGAAPRIAGAALALGAAAAIAYGGWRAATLLLQLPPSALPDLAAAAGASLLRVLLATLLGTAWTLPAGVAIGSNRRLAAALQPVAQILASVPATALFPALLLALLRFRGGLNVAAVALMLLGTQWYVLFNVIAGAMAIPRDLSEAGSIFKLRGWPRWRTLILPAVFPHLLTGLVTASGGAWNATIVSEYVSFRGQVHAVRGLGAWIAAATQAEDFPALLAGTATLSALVVAINRLVWRRLYQVAEERYGL